MKQKAIYSISNWAMQERIQLSVTDLINRIVQVLRKDLYWVKISTQNTKLIKPVKP